MTPNCPVASEPDEPDAPETPSVAAHLEIWAETVEGPLAEGSRGGGLPPPGRIPPAPARYLITALAIAGTVTATTVGVVLLHRSAPQFAFAVVLLGLTAVILIAIGGHWHEL
jgi:hypothetical protein